MRTSFHHQPEAQHPKIFSYPQAGPADYPIYRGVNGPSSDVPLLPSARAVRHRAKSISALCRMCRRHACTISPRGWSPEVQEDWEAPGCYAAPANSVLAPSVAGRLNAKRYATPARICLRACSPSEKCKKVENAAGEKVGRTRPCGGNPRMAARRS